MLDEDFDYDDYDYYPENKPFRVRLRNFFFGVVILGLIAVVAATLITQHMERTKSYGRIVAAGELYEAPIFENQYQAISYESLHPELASSKEVEKVVEKTTEEEKVQEEEKEESKEKAMENIIRLSSNGNSVREMTKERSEKYKLNEITTEETVTVGPTTGPASAGMDDKLGYYVGGPSQPVYVDPITSGAEYLGEWEITAYCACVLCCDKSDGITASGAMVQANHTVAGPKEFPFGTKLIIKGQVYVVEDRGGGIHGHRIDIYFNTHQEALNFGRQHLDVYKLP